VMKAKAYGLPDRLRRYETGIRAPALNTFGGYPMVRSVISS
jgi:hypothetical protein